MLIFFSGAWSWGINWFVILFCVTKNVRGSTADKWATIEIKKKRKTELQYSCFDMQIKQTNKHTLGIIFHPLNDSQLEQTNTNRK